jgi:hypothetical protein
MTLLNAPEFDAAKEERKSHLLLGLGALVLLLIILCLAGFLSGHGWLFSNLPVEHKVNSFFNALEAKDYDKAYGIYTGDPAWKQHPEKHSIYPIQRFTEDWTTYSPVSGPILNHHIDISKTDGSGTFGSGVIVAVRVNGDHKIFMYYVRSDGSLTWPAPHILEY